MSLMKGEFGVDYWSVNGFFSCCTGEPFFFLCSCNVEDCYLGFPDAGLSIFHPTYPEILVFISCRGFGGCFVLGKAEGMGGVGFCLVFLTLSFGLWIGLDWIGLVFDNGYIRFFGRALIGLCVCSCVCVCETRLRHDGSHLSETCESFSFYSFSSLWGGACLFMVVL